MQIYPISFSIHHSKIVHLVPFKFKQFATIIPGKMSTYIFNDEESYYNDYQNSIFGYTWKKGGWDCMRHYEILANGCIPFFKDLQQCPPHIMTHLPKDLILKAMNSTNHIDSINELLDYTRTNLTTKAMANYILSKIDKKVNSVLFLSGQTKPDYLRDLTLIGFKEIFGTNCIEHIELTHIYTDFNGNKSNFWGKGFSYVNILDPSLKNTDFSIEKLKNKTYDLIIYGSAHRGLPYLDEVTSIYDKSSIIFICGEDSHSMETCPAMHHGKNGHIAFIRELII